MIGRKLPTVSNSKDHKKRRNEKKQDGYYLISAGYSDHDRKMIHSQTFSLPAKLLGFSVEELGSRSFKKRCFIKNATKFICFHFNRKQNIDVCLS